ncbi:flavin reductase family protein [Janibacter sp. G56]|uniref:flavin reductase family protein n=1 Tax=Janibacter sp. G56 TaxID=3418717 RepID=UPI003CFDEB1C
MITPPTSDAFRHAMSRFATGVAVVSTTAGAHDHAMTANSLTSVSLDPMLMLVCVERDARFHDAVIEAGVWGISFLGHSQRSLAGWLSTPGRPLPGQLDRVPHHRGEATGVPLIDDALATIECRTTAVHAAGDHSIVVGEVLSVSAAAHADEALIYYRSGYGAVT